VADGSRSAWRVAVGDEAKGDEVIEGAMHEYPQ
jgi:hypothetical protein